MMAAELAMTDEHDRGSILSHVPSEPPGPTNGGETGDAAVAVAASAPPTRVRLESADVSENSDVSLWTVIRQTTTALGWESYASFLESDACREFPLAFRRLLAACAGFFRQDDDPNATADPCPVADALVEVSVSVDVPRRFHLGIESADDGVEGESLFASILRGGWAADRDPARAAAWARRWRVQLQALMAGAHPGEGCP
jgi:hypothetical protein